MGTEGLMTNLRDERCIDVEYFNAADLEALKSALKPNTKMVWLESPTNPHLIVVDIKAIADICHKYNKDVSTQKSQFYEESTDKA